MSLTADDLLSIRAIVREEVAPVDNHLQAVENDVKEIYCMLNKLQKQVNRGFIRIQKLEHSA